MKDPIISFERQCIPKVRMARKISGTANSLECHIIGTRGIECSCILTYVLALSARAEDTYAMYLRCFEQMGLTG
jgi:hypothetical protein